ncbi:MAG: hypothetical protein K2G01_05600 [Paramuribaculum sp.]|nr:hypothetical protein [Paramuribaculum sp.]MDE6323468.1 hypothetical protein [Paramuribaculum sp.]
MKHLINHLLVFLSIIIVTPAPADASIWKELKKAGKSALKEAKKDLENQGKQILNNATSGILGSEENTSTSSSEPLPASTIQQNSATATQFSTTTRRTAGKPAPIGNGMIRNLEIDNMGLNEMIFRIDRNIMLDNTGACLKGSVSVAIPDCAGKRIFCIIEPLSSDNNLMRDNLGKCSAIFAIDVTSANFTGDIRFAVPYQWCGIGMNTNLQNVNPFKFGISLVDFSLKDPVMADEIVTVDNSRINLDHQRVLQSGISDLMGDFGGGSGDMGMAMLGTLLGGSTDTITHTCGSCDGAGVCPHCDGVGFLDPSECNKCASNPGVCRRCNGKGKESSEVEINSVW